MTTRCIKSAALLAAAVVALEAATAGTAGVSPLKLSADMDSRQVVVPSRPRGDVEDATGKFVGTLARNGSRWWLAWRITYRKLDHPSVVIADMHRGKRGKFGPIVVRLCGPCRSGAHGVRRVEARDVPVIRSGRAFMTLITGKNPNGEVRGQIRAR